MIKSEIKELTYLLTLALILILSSCGPEDDEGIAEILDLSKCEVVPDLLNTRFWENNYPDYIDNRITLGALATYNDQLYLVDNNIDTVDIYVFDFDNERWILSKDSSLFFGLETIYQNAEALPWGLKGIDIIEDTLFTVGIERETFAALNLYNQEIVLSPQIELPSRPCGCSHGSSGIAYSYPYVYLAYHAVDYNSELTETQRLYGVDVRTNELIFDSQLNPSEKRGDIAHGLTTFNGDVWHVRDENLVQMSGKNGEIMNIYNLNHGSRSSSITYFNNSFWISTYFGGLFEVPLDCQ